MRKLFIIASAAAMALATPAAAGPWARSYVVSAYEPAFYWGGKLSYKKGELIAPGTDCPGGNTPALDLTKVIKAIPWRSPQDVENVLHPVGVTDPIAIDRSKIRASVHRGYRKDIDTYYNPFAAPDPGQDEVIGKIAEGFNLDGDVKTGGFTSPDGRRGIDNAYYRAWGCMGSFRGMPYHAQLSVRTTGVMLEGLFTIVVRLSGNKDPLNDDNVTMEVGYSPDHPVKGSNDKVMENYSFRIVKSAEYTRMKGTVKNGVYESESVAQLHMPNFGWFYQNQGDADFHKGRLRLVAGKDGSLSGLVGGYRDWRELYVENAFAQSGTTEEQREHQNMIGQYYALRRNADGMPDPKTGRNMGISIAYRFQALPAYVVDSPAPLDIVLPLTGQNQKGRMAMCREVFLKAISTKVIQQPVIAPSMQELREGAPLFRKPGPAIPAPGKLVSNRPDRVRDDKPATLASAAPGF